MLSSDEPVRSFGVSGITSNLCVCLVLNPTSAGHVDLLDFLENNMLHMASPFIKALGKDVLPAM